MISKRSLIVRSNMSLSSFDDDFGVNPQQRREVMLVSEPRSKLQARGRHAGAESWIDQLLRAIRQRVHVVWIVQHEAMHTVGHDFAGTVELCADDRQAHHERFEDDEAA